jgi:hypothetical protein
MGTMPFSLLFAIKGIVLLFLFGGIALAIGLFYVGIPLFR